MTDIDPADAQLTRLFTDLANDPAAPPSTVDASSVIRAARAAAAEVEADEAPDRPTDDGAGRPPVLAPVVDDPPPAEVRQFRPSRRRRTLVALLAAASLAAVAALVIPLSLSGGSSTNTSADAERAVAQSSAGDLSAGDLAAGAAAAPPTVKAAAPDQGVSSAAAAETAAAAGSAPAADAPADGFTAGAACWPALSEPVARALAAALPAGAYGDPEPLADDCTAAPVGGALLSGTIPPADATDTAAASAAAGFALTVRISAADPGACVDADPVTGAPCVPQLDGTYLATEGPGAPTVYVYGGGNEVAIGRFPGTGASSGLSIDQLAAAAQAVLGALG